MTKVTTSVSASYSGPPRRLQRLCSEPPVIGCERRRICRWLQGPADGCKAFAVEMTASHDRPMKTLIAIAGFITLALAATPASAQKPGAAPLLVDVDWVSQHLADRDLVLLHVGGPFASQHIPGARTVSEEDLSLPHDHSKMTDLMLEMPPIDVLLEKLSALGISDSSRIVVYAGANGATPSATRVIFTLDYVGLGDRTSLLNGGLAAWTRASKPVSAETTAPARGTLTPRAARNIIVDAEFVKSLAQRPGFRLVDARAPVFYRGIEPTINGKSGHIPGAVNIPFSDITDSQLVIDRDRVAKLFEQAGIKSTDTIVGYCHVGQQATAMLFAARLLGHEVRLYDGSFQDWAVNNRGPVEK
jgi:thiosulfate/3-mercaptopyruvate sulfurtransferase